MTRLALAVRDNVRCQRSELAQPVGTRGGADREPSRRGRPSPCSPAASLDRVALSDGPPCGGRDGDLDRCLGPRRSTKPATGLIKATSRATDVGDARAHPDEEATTTPDRSRPDSAGRSRHCARSRNRCCRRRGAQAAAPRCQLAAARRRARRQSSGSPPAIWPVTPSARVRLGTVRASPTAIPSEDDRGARQRRRLSSGRRKRPTR